jgi:protein-serine/threonine kinase
LIDKNGHLKLSDFGLSTGLHKVSDGEYYKRLLEQEVSKDNVRNSVQVNPINLTMTRAQIATWKANRRKLVSADIHRGEKSDLCILIVNVPGILHGWDS